jgi:hypothetical protein
MSGDGDAGAHARGSAAALSGAAMHGWVANSASNGIDGGNNDAPAVIIRKSLRCHLRRRYHHTDDRGA